MTAVSRSPVELARELVRVFEQWETAPGYVVVNVVVARALLAAEERIEHAVEWLPDKPHEAIDVLSGALSVLRGSE